WQVPIAGQHAVGPRQLQQKQQNALEGEPRLRRNGSGQVGPELEKIGPPLRWPPGGKKGGQRKSKQGDERDIWKLAERLSRREKEEQQAVGEGDRRLCPQ